MTTYLVKMINGESFLLSADMVHAEAGIYANWTSNWTGDDFDEDYGWEPTPFQTADARHDIQHAAKLVAEYAAACPEEREAKVLSVTEAGK